MNGIFCLLLYSLLDLIGSKTVIVTPLWLKGFLKKEHLTHRFEKEKVVLQVKNESVFERRSVKV